MDGSHSIGRCEEITNAALSAVFQKLREHEVALEGIILKPNMIISGAHVANRASTAEVAEATVRCLRANVPHDVPGIAFLSGGQSEIESSKNLNEINKINDTNLLITFSYGRGLQASALK